MKKFLYLMLSIMIVLSPVSVEAKKTTTKAKDPVNVYIFYGSSCGFCAKLHEYTASLENDKTMNKKFKIVDYEVWYDADNSALMQKVANYFEYTLKGVPFYVVGDQYFSGFDDNSGEELKAAINEEYNDKDYKDIVGGIVAGTIEVQDKEEDEKSNSDTVAYVILGITVAIVLAILLGRSKDTEIEETTLNDDKEKETTEKKTEKKKTTKKNTKKK